MSTIRPLTEDDIPIALGLCRSAGWNQLHADWSRLIKYEPTGCFAAKLDDQIVGTVTTTRYGTDLAWIGMMLVDERFRRRGVATELINASLSYLRDARARCIKLDATPAGHPVYERLGFKREGTFHRWARDSKTAPRWNPPQAAGSLRDSHLQLDKSAFAADRSEWLARTAQVSHVATHGNSFGLARAGFLANYLGPVVGDTRSDTKQVVSELLSRLSGQTFWDVPPDNPAAAELANSFGFQPVRELARMRIGSMAVRPAMHLQFALSDPGTG